MAPATLTLGQAINEWLGQHIKSTKRTYGYDIHQMSGKIGTDKLLVNVTSLDVLRFVSFLNSDDANYAPKTVNKKIKTIRTFFNWCKRQHWIENSPADGTKYHNASEYVGREKAATDAEYMRLKQYFLNPYGDWRPPIMRFRNLALLHFLADTGCRIGEARGLQVQHINWHTYEAQVLGKNHKIRPVWFGQECAQALRYWLSVRPTDACDHVFTRKPEPPSVDGLRVMFWRCFEKGVVSRSVSPHMFRHRKAFTLFDMGTSAGIVAAVLGDTVDIVLRYYCPTDYNSARSASLMMIQNDEKLVALLPAPAIGEVGAL